MLLKGNTKQHIFHEISVTDDVLCRIPDRSDSDVILNELRLDLLDRLIELAGEHLTELQRSVFNYTLLGGLTQQRTADLLGITQATVSHTIHGVPHYNYLGRKGNYYRSGGILYRLRKVCAADQKIQELLAQIAERLD